MLVNDDAERLRVLGFAQEASGPTDAEVEKLIAERDKARRKGDYATGDRIRKQLADAGVILEDKREGVRWKRR